MGFIPAATNQFQQLHVASHSNATYPIRQQLTFSLPHVVNGDMVSVSVYPHDDMNCDGIYLNKWQLWEHQDANELALGTGV